jgi:hypothetical protein
MAEFRWPRSVLAAQLVICEGHLHAIRGCESFPQSPEGTVGRKQTEARKGNAANGNLRSTPLCPTNSSRSDLSVKSSRSTNRRQSELMRSGPFEAIQRTLRFSRHPSRRKVFFEHEKRNVDGTGPRSATLASHVRGPNNNCRPTKPVPPVTSTFFIVSTHVS